MAHSLYRFPTKCLCTVMGSSRDGSTVPVAVLSVLCAVLIIILSVYVVKFEKLKRRFRSSLLNSQARELVSSALDLSM